MTNKNKPGTFKNSTRQSKDNNLHHLAFHNSLQATFIATVSTGKIITANKAFCKLLDYSRRELLNINREVVFDINESSFKKMLQKRKAEGQVKGLVTVIKKGGGQIPCEITSAVFTDENGIEKAITTIVDISERILQQNNIDTKKEKIVADNIVLAKSKQREIDTRKEKIVTDNITLAQAKSDAMLAENNEWIKYIAKTSYDVMWDWNIVTGEIYVGDSIEEVFGYKVQNNTIVFDDFIECLLTEEKDAIEKKILSALASDRKSWKDSYSFKRKDGTVASTASRASIVRDDSGKAIRLIGAIHDISRIHELENKLGEQTTIQNKNESSGSGSMNDRKSLLIKKIKNVVEELVHDSNEQLQTNFSVYISKKLDYDYTYLANLFSEGEGIPIRKFIISKKIERVKELIENDELNLTEIALELNYSSVAHLSHQFKIATGFTPSHFKQLNRKRRNTPANV